MLFQLYAVLVIFILAIILYLKKSLETNYWKKLGVPHVPPVPVFGNDFYTVIGVEGTHLNQVRKYNYLKNHKFGGTFIMTIPFFFPRDPGLIEHILIKDFSNFYNRGIKINEKVDPLMAHLFNLEDKRWKNLRSKLTPAFTSGKLKTMHQQLIDCADVLVEQLEMLALTDDQIDFKDTMAKFTTDVIGACAYGLNINALKNPQSEFRRMGKKFFEANFKTKIRQMTRQLLRVIHPDLIYWLNFKVMLPEVEDFFSNLVKDTIKIRENNNITRNDFIQLLINQRKQESTSPESKEQDTSAEVALDDNVLAANAFLFFIAGFETTASTLSYCLFELSKNQILQDKVYHEIKTTLEKYEGQPTYEAIKQMPLLDMVISETLRKYPPAPFLFRQCNENYKVPDSNFVIPKGCRIEIPVYALHHDSEIFANPDSFIPERFSEENRKNIPKGAYLPFGDGPRVCIGARFAQMEMKVCLSKVLSNFKLTRSEMMKEEIEFDPKSLFILMPKGGIYVNIDKR